MDMEEENSGKGKKEEKRDAKREGDKYVDILVALPLLSIVVRLHVNRGVFSAYLQVQFLL